MSSIARTSLYISELLFVNDCVIIPGLGGFVANTRSAFLNPAQHTFTPPSRRVAFNASLRTNDGLLANYLSRRVGLSYGEALTRIKQFVDEVLAKLQAGDQVWMDKIGALSFDNENRIQFEPDLTENYLTDAFGLVSIHSPAIRREEVTAKVKKLKVPAEKKKRQGWRLLELIPAAAVLALLVFNPNVIQKLNTGLAEVFPIHEIALESPVENTVSKPAAELVVPEASSSKAEMPAAETVEPAPTEQAVTTPVDSTRVEPVAIEKEAVVEKHIANGNGATFYVIGGCFKIEENARKLVEEAKLLGYDAQLIGENEKGLHVVSLYSSNDMSKVQSQLSEIKTGFEKGAWVLVK